MIQNSGERQNRRNVQWKKRRRHRFFFLACIAVLLVGVGIFASRFFASGEGTGDGLSGKPPKVEEPVELTIACVGDIMVHSTQLAAQYDSATGTYNFDDNFEYIKKYIEKADLALCNVETTFAGGKYSGYPAFNSPDALADALKNAGFHVAITSNNHMMDKGFSGMQRTIEVLRSAGLLVTGSRLSGETGNYVIKEVNGIKIAVVAYTYETPGVNGRRTLNGNYLSDEAKQLINSFSYNSLDADLAAMENAITSAREEGADLVAAYFHWGEEYQRTPNDWQQTIAQKAANAGADMIFASHPHVLQGVEMLTVNHMEGADEKNIPVFYSMGNLISNQRAETLNNNRYTEQGMIAHVRLKFMKSTGKIMDISMDAIPTWVDRYKINGEYNYAIVPLDGEMEQNPALVTSGHLKRAKQALEDITELLGEEYITKNL